MPCTWLQYLGSVPEQLDVAATDYEAHIDVQPGEVVFMPLEIAAKLTSAATPLWQGRTVVPGTLTTVRDAATGLGTVDVPAANPWGLPDATHAYFAPAGDLGDGDCARLFVTAGQPILAQT